MRMGTGVICETHGQCGHVPQMSPQGLVRQVFIHGQYLFMARIKWIQLSLKPGDYLASARNPFLCKLRTVR
jgi:hypothetical protein